MQHSDNMSTTGDIRTQLETLIQQADQQAAAGKEVEVVVVVVNEQEIRPQEEAAEEPAFVVPEKLIPVRRIPPVWFLAPTVLVFLAVTAIQVFPLLLPTTTITIVPRSLTEETTVEIKGADVSARVLPAMTLAQQTTVKVTGIAHQDATAASGYITFYNSALYAQTIGSGEVLQAGDVEIVTDQTASIPAGNGETNGKATVAAHATFYGPAGNIAAYRINGPCCRPNILARNLAAFSGGQAARDYQVVQQGDIDQAGVKPTETFITPFPCTFTPSSDHKAGTEAATVTVILSATCTGMTYNTQMMTSLATGLLEAQVGEGYAALEDVEIKVLQVGSSSLRMHLAGSFVYQFQPQELTHLKTLIAGQQVKEATAILLSQPGVHNVVLSGNMLP